MTSIVQPLVETMPSPSPTKGLHRLRTRHRILLAFAGAPLAASLAFPLFLRAQVGPSIPAVPAKTLAMECAKNEEQVIQHPGSYLRYTMHEVNPKGDLLRDQIETPEGTVARAIERDGHPLTAEQDAAERSRLNAMLANPDEFARHVRRDDEGKKTGLELLRAMPGAMLWSYAEAQPQLAGHKTGDTSLVVLDFKPDPKWSAPDMEAEMLTGLEGRVWIDPQTRRLVHLEATVFRAVNVGLGVVAHVYPGGTITLDQVSADADRWMVSHTAQQFTVRALMVKNVRQQSITDTSNYRPVPAMTYQQAIKVLLDTPLPQH